MTAPRDDGSGFVTTTEAARQIGGVSDNYVREAIENGELDAIEIGHAGRRKQYRIPVAALRAYLERRRRAGGRPTP